MYISSVFDVKEYRKLKKIVDVKKKKLKAMKKRLKKARRNDDHQNIEMILQKDMKMYECMGYRFGNSTVKYDFERWIDREGSKVTRIEKNKLGMILSMKLEEFRKDLGFDFYFVGCKMKKQRHFISINFPYIRFFVKKYRFEELNYKGFTYYKIPVEMTRKILMPLVVKSLKGIDGWN